MMREWRPTRWAALITGYPYWSLTLGENKITVTIAGKEQTRSLLSLSHLRFIRGWVWGEVELTFLDAPYRQVFRGLTNRQANLLKLELASTRERHPSNKVQPIGQSLAKWLSAKFSGEPGDRWICHEDLIELQAQFKTEKRNASGTSATKHSWSESASKLLDSALLGVLDFLNQGPEAEARKANERFLKAELVRYRDFFAHVEKQPLSREQAVACICFENRVLAVAAAGSGKTSTMVAKAGYAVHKGLFQASEILMLAFNRDAAEELKQRTQRQLKSLVPEADQVEASTFHKFGLDVIGEATGRRPRVARWVDQGKDIEEIVSIIETLKRDDIGFRGSWFMWQNVLANNIPSFDGTDEPEDYDRETKQRGFRTYQGEVVKSKEERVIANWLYANSVEYEYESRYEIDTADSKHSQYYPDFFYPSISLYHEHFALDADGKPPLGFEGYLEGVEWKRDLHRQHKTDLFETTSATLSDGVALIDLERMLTSKGVVLAQREMNDVAERQVPDTFAFARTLRVFLGHAKSNRLNHAKLSERLGTDAKRGFLLRDRVFLSIYGKVAAEWQTRLERDNCIDFEDMLNLAADHIESGNWKSPYKLVMIDEFQDASVARARLIDSLIREPGHFLFAVGDDWQGINRFAGADIGVMTGFSKNYGKRAKELRLTETFRCPQSLCDATSSFIKKNPNQIKKKVRSNSDQKTPSLHCWSVEDAEAGEVLLGEHLKELAAAVESGRADPLQNGRVSALILGRYNGDQPRAWREWAREYGDRIDIKWTTVHRAKGAEADYVFVVNVVSGIKGFPSRIEDDPVLRLAMPSGDVYPQAEERRIFYVALTRAKRQVRIYTSSSAVSEFLTEMKKNGLITITSASNEEVRICPKCKKGVEVRRTGPTGDFIGCKRFPACDYTREIAAKTKKHSAKHVTPKHPRVRYRKPGRYRPGK